MSETAVGCTSFNVAKRVAQGTFPQRVGDAVLVFYDARKTCRLPVATRKENVLSLPMNEHTEMIFLQDERQFLIFHDDRIWFGGTDARTVFLAELGENRKDAWDTALDHGEEAFYRSLVPSIVFALEKAFGCQRKRQGDMFFCRLPAGTSMEVVAALIRLVAEVSGFTVSDACEQVHDYPLLGTSHRLTGTVFFDDLLECRYFSFAVVTGTVSHPEHDPLVLEGPHIAVLGSQSD